MMQGKIHPFRVNEGFRSPLSPLKPKLHTQSPSFIRLLTFALDCH